eukprot:jgi/Psemu1/37750/gm1.37750_g
MGGATSFDRQCAERDDQVHGDSDDDDDETTKRIFHQKPKPPRWFRQNNTRVALLTSIAPTKFPESCGSAAFYEARDRFQNLPRVSLQRQNQSRARVPR